MLGRRKLLVTLGVTVGVSAAASVGLVPARAFARPGQGGHRAAGGTRLVVPAGERFTLLGEPLRAGMPVAWGSVEAVLPWTAGAVPVVMRTPAGEQFQVDILRRDPGGPGGVAETALLSLFVVNQGDGSTRTSEAQAHAARGLAGWLAARESEAKVAGLGALLSHRERQQAHPGGVLALWR